MSISGSGNGRCRAGSPRSAVRVKPRARERANGNGNTENYSAELRLLQIPPLGRDQQDAGSLQPMPVLSLHPEKETPAALFSPPSVFNKGPATAKPLLRSL